MPSLGNVVPVAIGDIVDNRYQLEAVLSQGQRAHVFRGRQVSLNRDVAVKVLSNDSGPEESRRFFHEAKTVAQLEHPNCVQILDYGQTRDGVKFIAMQFAGGHRLSMDLGQPFEPLRATKLVADVLRGLEHAHGRGVVHRELTPEHLSVSGALDGHERLMIADFGGSGSSNAGPALTMSEMLAGNPKYMSPEQGAGLEADERSDIYSAGIIFFELLTGRAPFDDEDPVSTLQQHIETPLPALPPSIAPQLRTIIAKMCEKDRNRRYEFASDALAELENYLRLETISTTSSEYPAAEPIASAPVVIPTTTIDDTGPLPVASGHERGSGATKALLAVAAVALLGTAGFLWMSSRGADPPSQAAVTEGGEPSVPAGDLALLAQLNDASDPLDFTARHQALELLASTAFASKVDQRLQIRLDLVQAAQAPNPCPEFRDALQKIRDADDRYFDEALASAVVPPTCNGAAEELSELRVAAAPRAAAVAPAALVDPMPQAETSAAAPEQPSRRRRSATRRPTRRKEAAPPTATATPEVKPQPTPPPAPAPKKPAADAIPKLGSGLKGIIPVP